MIITQTVGQMTENVPSTTIATQTPLPRTYLSFDSLATKTKLQSNSKLSSFEKQMMENDLLLQTQRNALKTIDLKLKENCYSDRDMNDGNSMCKQLMSNDVQGSNAEIVLPFVAGGVAGNRKIDKIAVKMVVFYFRFKVIV